MLTHPRGFSRWVLRPAVPGLQGSHFLRVYQPWAHFPPRNSNKLGMLGANTTDRWFAHSADLESQHKSIY